MGQRNFLNREPLEKVLFAYIMKQIYKQFISKKSYVKENLAAEKKEAYQTTRFFEETSHDRWPKSASKTQTKRPQKINSLTKVFYVGEEVSCKLGKRYPSHTARGKAGFLRLFDPTDTPQSFAECPFWFYCLQKSP